MAQGRWLIYGAYGYSGRLIVEEARRRGMEPVVAGRREEAVRALADRHGLPWRAFSLDDNVALRREAAAFDAILLAAGPFSATSRPVVDACLAERCHYLDITGEIDVFEACQARDAEARARGVVLMPGVGLDVVPSDCLALALREALPDATRLELALHSQGGMSRGTARTAVEGMPRGGAERRGGQIVRVPAAHRTAEIPFRDRPRLAVSIPWGDVSTAYYTTGIPDITVYMAMPPRVVRAIRLARPLLPLLGVGALQVLLKAAVDRLVTGPSEETRRTARAQLWGRVTDATGRSVEGTLITPEGYALTAMTAVEATRRVVGGEVEPGARTPAGAFGAAFIAGFEGCDLEVGGARIAAPAGPKPTPSAGQESRT